MKPAAYKWAKLAHVVCACLWGGGAMALVLLHLAVEPATGDGLYVRDLCLKRIDDLVVFPGALGCFCTGIIFAQWAGYGYFKHGWIMIKGAVNAGFIIFGLVYFMPALNALMDISRGRRDQALVDPAYISGHLACSVAAVGMAASLALVLWLTIFRPRIRPRG